MGVNPITRHQENGAKSQWFTLVKRLSGPRDLLLFHLDFDIEFS